MNNEKTLPEWAKPGAKAYILERSQLTPVTISRTTKTQIIIERPTHGGTDTYTRRFTAGRIYGDYTEIGTDAYWPSTIVPDDDPRVAARKRATEERQTRAHARRLADRFDSNPTPDNARAAIDALTAYIAYTEQAEAGQAEQA